jgi:uncharacterized membrane protein YphA (DoxX/SURF4 family)
VVITVIYRYALAGVYLYAGFSKVFKPLLFQSVIEGYFAVPSSIALFLAILIPWLQIVAALAVVLNKYPFYSCGLLLIMSIFFLGLMVLNYENVLPYGCGCFGFTENEVIGNYHIARELLITLLAGITFYNIYKDKLKEEKT